MKLFVYEHVTGGGMLAEDPPASLVLEADMMVRSLLADLAELPGVVPLAARDPRLPRLDGVPVLTREPDEGVAAFYRRGLTACDAAWPTAPETGGVLEALARATIQHGRTLVGCRPDAVHVAASKRRTSQALAARGIPVVPTWDAGRLLPDLPGAWVVKPDDGAGAEDTLRVPDRGEAAELLGRDPGRLVAQPWLDGEPLSLSLLCRDGTAELLSCNRQRLELTAGRLSLVALEVNAVADTEGALAQLGGRVAAAIPGLLGPVGVDFIRTAGGPVILEVNPRLTTSCCGLREALGINLAALVLEGHAGIASPERPRGPGRCITLALAGAHA